MFQSLCTVFTLDLKVKLLKRATVLQVALLRKFLYPFERSAQLNVMQVKYATYAR